MCFCLKVYHNVGIKTAKQLEAHYKTFENFMNASKEDLITLPDISYVIADCITSFFKDPNNIKELEELKAVGVRVKNYSAMQINTDSYFSNKKVVLTGSLTSMTRQEATKKIENLGGEVISSVSKNTSLVVVGSEPGSKYQKALSLNIPIINEDEFISKLNQDL